MQGKIEKGVQKISGWKCIVIGSNNVDYNLNLNKYKE